MPGIRGQSSDIVAASTAMREIIELVDMVAATDCSILIEGESGTGKELIARRLHEKSTRRAEPFVPVNCAGISENLFESQFFGHVRGAFTGAEQTMLGLVRAAEGGTLFLDEVAEIPLHIQAKLLRVFQEGELIPVGTNRPVQVNTRFVVATNRSLREQVALGRFRADLFYRLNIVRIHLPPLRERPEEIPALLDHYLKAYAERFGRPVICLEPAVLSLLRGFSWPGNVRELASWVERVYATGVHPRILAQTVFGDEIPTAGPAAPESVLTLREAEKRAIQKALDAAESNVEKAAQLLQIHRTTLWRKLRVYKTS